MAKKKLLLGIPVVVLVLGMAVIGCTTTSSTGGANSINGWSFDVGNDRNYGGGSSTISMRIDGNRVTVTGNLTQDAGNGAYGWAMLYITPNASFLSQLKNGSSVGFDIIGDGKPYRLDVVTSDVRDGDFYQANFSTQNGVRDTIVISYSDLKQAGWGNSVSFNRNNITGLQIAAATDLGGTGSFSFTFVVRE